MPAQILSKSPLINWFLKKRELKKRNAQAQTNICQYLRKHNIDLSPMGHSDKSQQSLRDDYSDR
jgi:uncharacterized protein YpiB (UPF0302 family)